MYSEVAQGHVGVSLIKTMCSAEAPLWNAIKQFYRPPLPTFFFSTFHLYDKMPSPRSEHISPPTDSSRIMSGRGWRWGGRGEVTTGLLKVIMAAIDYWVSSPSLFMAGRERATACMLISRGRDEGRRAAGRGSYGRGPGKESHLMPRLLVQPRRRSLSNSIGGDRDVTGAWAVCLPSHLISGCFQNSCSRQFYDQHHW